jgi:hypothetical protein
MRVSERNLHRNDVEQTIRNQHRERAINTGRAQWRVIKEITPECTLVVIYDHPHFGDPNAVRIVSAWPL